MIILKFTSWKRNGKKIFSSVKRVADVGSDFQLFKEKGIFLNFLLFLVNKSTLSQVSDVDRNLFQGGRTNTLFYLSVLQAR